MSQEVQDFNKEVIERSFIIPVLVDFWAVWCGPCKMLGPILERLAAKNADRWVLAKVDTDRNEDIAVRYGVRGIPNVKLFIDGKVANEFTGALPEHMVVQWLEKALPPKAAKDVDRAEQLIAEKSLTEGRRLLEEILAREPENERARTLLARTFVGSEPARAVDLVKGIEEHSEQFPMVQAIRTVGELVEKMRHPETLPQDPVKATYLAAIFDMTAGNYDAALDKFIDVIRVNRYYDDDGPRKACIAIFKILGDDNVISQRHRREFSSALY